MGCAKYVGRVGAFAVALGVGSAIAGAAGVAAAEPTNPDTASATEPGPASPPAPGPDEPASNDDAQPPADAPTDPADTPAPESATESTVEVAPGVVVSSSGGPHTSTHSASERVSKKPGKTRQTAAPSSTPESTSTRRSVDADADADAAKPSVSSPAPSAAKQSSSPPTFAAPATVRASVPQPSTTPPSAAPAPIVNVVLSALAAAFGATGGPTVPVQSPMAWVVAAVARRDLGEPLDATAVARSSAVTLAAAAPNQPPTNPVATVGTPNASTGVVTGTVSATDPDGDTLTYTTGANTTKGTVTITNTGAFTYTPTAAARHAAAAVGATTAKQDTFTVTIKDPYGGTTTKTVTVTVIGKNTAPTGYSYTGYPNATTGVVTGSIAASDNDYDPLTYSATNTTKGTITVTNTGAWTYTPTAAARHAAAAPNAPTATKQDTFTIAVKDGYGGTANINVTVTVLGKNTAPTNASATVTNTNVRTGVVTGAVTVVDPEDSTFTYTSTTSTKGSLAFGGNGSFTYTPTQAARQAATAPNATTATKTDTFTITVDDGYGGRASTVLNVAVTPLGINGPIAGVNTTVGQPNQALGVVEGTVKGVDPEGDALTYTLTGGPSRGTVVVDAVTGAFTYTPTVQARYDATVRPGQVVDGFTVRVADAFGASTSVAVTAVPVAPYAAWAIDQRPSSVGVSDPYLYYASQAETDAILDALQASGVDTVRIHVPWAWVEPVDDTYDWTAIDRMVDSARARNMTVLATLNHTPEWAATPGTPALSGVPADPQKYADFAGDVAARYAGRISAYEVWNEPNGKMFWEPEPNAAQYTALLRAAYPAIKLADPNATVLAGSMGNVPDTPGESIHAVRFVEQMYANGAAGYFDALAYHPYQYWVPFSDADVYQVHPRAQMEAIHQLMVANGDGEKLIWATEYGQPAAVGGELQQAEYLADFLRTWREIDYAGPAYLYTTRDDDSTNPADASFGLFRADWTRKAAIGAVEDVIDENDAADAERNL